MINLGKVSVETKGKKVPPELEPASNPIGFAV